MEWGRIGASPPARAALAQWASECPQLAGFATLTRFLHELWPFATLVFLIGYFFHTRKISTLLERTGKMGTPPFVTSRPSKD